MQGDANSKFRQKLGFSKSYEILIAIQAFK